jgi:hypothetical protein
MENEVERLKLQLREAAQRFLDVADILEKEKDYNAVGFLRASGKRYMQEAEK